MQDFEYGKSTVPGLLIKPVVYGEFLDTILDIILSEK